jgi:hypothetical protein
VKGEDEDESPSEGGLDYDVRGVGLSACFAFFASLANEGPSKSQDLCQIQCGGEEI